MSSYLFFNGNKENFGDQDTLGDHLDYLENWGGSADCWDTFEGTRKGAIAVAQDEHFPIYVVDECEMRVVAKVNF